MYWPSTGRGTISNYGVKTWNTPLSCGNEHTWEFWKLHHLSSLEILRTTVAPAQFKVRKRVGNVKYIYDWTECVFFRVTKSDLSRYIPCKSIEILTFIAVLMKSQQVVKWHQEGGVASPFTCEKNHIRNHTIHYKPQHTVHTKKVCWNYS